MQVYDTQEPNGSFDVLGGTERSQAATMVLEPGEATGGPQNSHPEADQWLYVVSGEGTTTVDGEDYELHTGSLVSIEADENHEIRAGEVALTTISVYAPPVY